MPEVVRTELSMPVLNNSGPWHNINRKRAGVTVAARLLGRLPVVGAVSAATTAAPAAWMHRLVGP